MELRAQAAKMARPIISLKGNTMHFEKRCLPGFTAASAGIGLPALAQAGFRYAADPACCATAAAAA